MSVAPRVRVRACVSAEKPVLSCCRFPSFSVFDAAFEMNSESHRFLFCFEIVNRLHSR